MATVQIRYHGVEASETLSELIRTRAAHLARLSRRIHALRVLVDAPHHHHHKGNHYRVRLELTLPGRDLVVGHDDDERLADADPYQAVRRAFDVLRRKLAATQTQRQGGGRGRDTIRNRSLA